MVHSIQEILKKINTSVEKRLSWLDIASLASVFLIFSLGFITLGIRDITLRKEVIYHESAENEAFSSYSDIKRGNPTPTIVASSKGKTYFFSWCKGADKIKETNKIVFTNEDEAKASGRVLSKTCAQ